MDSALSIWFLLLWLGGDGCNLVGSFLADQLPLQVTCSEANMIFRNVLRKALFDVT